MIPLRLWLILGGSVMVLALLGGAVWKIRHDEAARWKPKLEAAQAQVKSEQATTKALDHYTREITIVREKADGAVAQVQQAPGADTPVPAAILDAWARGLRHEDPATPDAEHPR